MTRMLNALKADIKFQIKQGFYTVYIFITIMYMIVISQFSIEIKEILVPLVVFSDPSMLGFFFIGAIVMLEKVQGILRYVVVTPLRTREYLTAKVISLTILAVTAGTVITLTTYGGKVNWLMLIGGILLTSVFFTLFGFIAAAGCSSMNQYFIKMVPYILVITLPCFALTGFSYAWVFDIFPSLAGLRLVYGAFHNLPVINALGYGAYMILANALMLLYVEKVFEKMVFDGV